MSTEEEAPWRKKAKLIIAQFCLASYKRENRLTNGKLRKQHRPYAVPEVAQQLVKVLDQNDEETAKAIFLYNYEVQKLE